MRVLRKNPVFTAVAVLTLALGIGVNTAVFTVVNGVLLHPLPFREAGQLEMVSDCPRKTKCEGGALWGRDFVVFRRENRSFESATTFSMYQVSLLGADEPVRASEALVTPEFFSVFGVSPMIGRAFAGDEGDAGGAHVVILSSRFWRSHFGADAGVLGRRVTLAGNPFLDGGSYDPHVDRAVYTVIGVMPDGFAFPQFRTGAWGRLGAPDIWIPVTVAAGSPMATARRAVVGRLRYGVSPDQALGELEAMSPTFAPPPSGDRSGYVVHITPLRELLVGNARTPLLVFAGAVAFVLLIAYANVASLLLMRVVSREQEMAIRAALGAERQRLIRQLVTESVVLSLIGAAAGVLVAFGGVRVLLSIAPTAAIPLRDSIRVDGWMLTMTVFVALVTGIGFGIAPSLRATRGTFGTTLSRGTRVASGRHMMLRVLAVSEIALALVLLTGASLMVRSFLRLRAVELGFHPEQVVTMSVKLPATKYGHSAPVNEFRERVLAELERVPQVLAVGAVNWLPLTLQGLKESITVEGQAAPQWGTVRNGVSGDYFRSMAIPLVSGRTFDDHDDAGAPRVVVISRSLADSLWPHENPLGKRIADYAGPRDTAQALQRPTDWLTVVGVVGNVVPADLTQGPLPTLYEPMRQFPDSERQAALLAFSSFTVRTTGDLATVERAMRKAVQLADPEQPVESVAPMQGLVDATRQDALFQARLLVVFSAIALVLALVGIYGVMSFKVTERTREIGIRMALGAEMNDVVQVVVGEALALAGGGVLIGLGGAFVATRVLRSLLFGVETWDPATYAAVAGLLVGAAALASWVPARRATRVDPVQALRAD